MLNEDLIKQVADSLSQRLLSNNAAAAKGSQRPLLILGEELSSELRQEILAKLPPTTTYNPADKQPLDQLLTTTSVIVIAGLSLDLASKIVYLQTDNSAASLIIRALFENKRVVATNEGILNPTNYSNLRPGMARAVSDLRNRLSDMGIIFLSIAELPDNLYQSVNEPIINRPLRTNVAEKSNHSLPIIKDLPISQHPTQQKVNINSSLNEFVEYLQSQPCRMEKDKPCDQCDICNTLGF